ncbi:MAG: cysteine hydrolase family protein [Lachnospirales bacterium]
MKKILVVVDMQNDFIDGALGTKEAVGIIDNVVEKIKSYDISNVYATRDTHFENYLETNEGKNLPVVHCVKDSFGWQINDRVKKALGGAKIIDKETFGSLKLCEILKEENKKEEIEIELIGLCTDICVVSNAILLKAYMPEINIKVDAKCCAGVTPESHRASLETMKMCQIEILNY